MPTVCAFLSRQPSRFTLHLTGLVCLGLVACRPTPSEAAEARTRNFAVTAGDAPTARAIAVRAEELRLTLAVEWLGRELLDWSSPCRVDVNTSTSRLRGETTYRFQGGSVSNWRIELSGPDFRILDTLLPHEIVHTILVSHFQRPLPRWADEGAAQLAEAHEVRQRLWRMEQPRLSSNQRIPLRELWATSHYPASVGDLRAFYVQGASVTEFLTAAGKTHFVAFVASGMDNGWDAAVRQFYGFNDVDHLETVWSEWVRQDRPLVSLGEGARLVTAFRSADVAYASLTEIGSMPDATGSAE